MLKFIKYKFIIILIFSIALFSSPIYSQTRISTSPEDAIVRLGDQNIIEIKSSLGNLSPAERAVEISNELRNKALHSKINIDDTELSQQNNQYVVYLKDALITLTKDDLNGKDPNDFVEQLKNYLEEYRKNNILGSNSLYSYLFYILIFLVIFLPIITVWLPQKLTRIFRKIQKYIILPIFSFSSSIDKKTKIPQPLESENILNEQLDNQTVSSWNYKSIEEVKNKFNVGEIDHEGRQIIFVYKIRPTYVIYLAQGIDETGYVTYAGDSKKIKNCDKLSSIIVDIYANQVKDFDNPESINFQIASGIDAGIKSSTDEEIEVANKILEGAKNSVINWRIKRDRLEYLLSSFGTFIALLIVSISLAIVPELSQGRVVDLLFIFDIPNDFLLALIFSALGGFLSASIKSSQIQLTQDIDLSQAATMRIYIAIVSGILVYAIIRSNYIPDLTGILSETDIKYNNWKIATISAMAGFIEYFIPNLLTPTNNANRADSNG